MYYVKFWFSLWDSAHWVSSGLLVSGDVKYNFPLKTVVIFGRKDYDYFTICYNKCCHSYNQETRVMFWKMCLLFSLQAIFFLRRKKENCIQVKLRIRTQQADSQDALRTVLPVRSQRHSHKGRKGRRLKVLSFIVTKMNHVHLAGKDKEKGWNLWT